MTDSTKPTLFDDLDRRLLRAVQIRCTMSAEEIAETCGTSPSTALRRLNRLRCEGVISREVAVIEGAAVGRPLLMIISVATKRGREADVGAFKREMLANPAVQQLYFVTGKSDYVVAYSAASMEDYDDFIESVLAIDPNLLTQTNVVIRPLKVGLSVNIPTLPALKQKSPAPSSRFSSIGLDHLDRRLLRAVQKKCALTADELADLCATSPSTALRRLNRLRSAGVIREEVALLDPGKVGRGLLLLIAVRLEREDGPKVDAFVRRVSQHANVQQFYFVTGMSDYLIFLSVGGMEEYDDFLKANLVPDPIVVMSSTSVVIRPLKLSLSVPID